MRIFDAITGFLGVCSGIIFFAMALGITADVILKLFSINVLNWLGDLVEYGMYVATFLAAPWILGLGGHVRVDFVLTNIPPSVASVIERAANVVGALLCAGAAYYATKVLIVSWTRGDVVLKNLIFPEWWLTTVMPVSFALLAIEFALRVANLRTSEETLSL